MEMQMDWERASVIVKGVQTNIRELYRHQKLLCSVGYPLQSLTPYPHTLTHLKTSAPHSENIISNS